MFSPLALATSLVLGVGCLLLPGLRIATRMGVASVVVCVVGLGTPALVHRARARAEAPIIANLYLLALKQEAFQAARLRDLDRDGRGEFGTLLELYRARPPLIHEALSAGEEFGYRYYVMLGHTPDADETHFYAYAIPASYGVTGRRAVYVDESQIVRIADIGTQALVMRDEGAAWEPAVLPEEF